MSSPRDEPMMRERTFMASDGAPLRYRVWEPPVTERGALLFFNGVMSHAGWFAPLAPVLIAAGWRMIGADRRGSGPNRVARGDAPSAGQLIDDAVTLAGAERFPGQGGIVVGWCWGAALAISVAAKLNPRPSGLALITPGLHPSASVLASLQRSMGQIRPQGETSRAEDDAWIDTPIAEEMFTRGPALENFVRRDEDRVLTMTERMVRISRQLQVTAYAKLKQLGIPVSVYLAEQDEATDNVATRELFARLPGVDVHELPGAHGLQFDQPDLLARHLAEFAERAVHSQPGSSRNTPSKKD